MKTTRLPCGCRHTVGDRELWTELCPPHKAEADEIHARAQSEHHEAMARFYDRPAKENRA